MTGSSLIRSFNMTFTINRGPLLERQPVISTHTVSSMAGPCYFFRGGCTTFGDSVLQEETSIYKCYEDPGVLSSALHTTHLLAGLSRFVLLSRSFSFRLKEPIFSKLNTFSTPRLRHSSIRWVSSLRIRPLLQHGGKLLKAAVRLSHRFASPVPFSPFQSVIGTRSCKYPKAHPRSVVYPTPFCPRFMLNSTLGGYLCISRWTAT